jgi:solute carrier family 6 GABA transporter-like protein 1
VPQWLDVFIVPERREDWKQPVAPNVLRDTTEGVVADGLETGSTEEAEKKREFDGRRADSDLLSGNSETLDGVSSSSRSDDMASQMRRPDPVADNKAAGL